LRPESPKLEYQKNTPSQQKMRNASATERGTIPQVLALLQDAEQANFWGSIQIDFRNGQATLIRKTETLRIDNPDQERNSPNGNPAPSTRPT
jgi:hypothetical protein